MSELHPPAAVHLDLSDSLNQPMTKGELLAVTDTILDAVQRDSYQLREGVVLSDSRSYCTAMLVRDLLLGSIAMPMTPDQDAARLQVHRDDYRSQLAPQEVAQADADRRGGAAPMVSGEVSDGD